MYDGKMILYFGDTSLDGAAAYFAGVVARAGFSLVYTASDEQAKQAIDKYAPQAAAFVLSDYPAVNLDEASEVKIMQAIANGAGLLMIGGWESFAGFAGKEGGWQHQKLSEILPVWIKDVDDRVNYDQPAFVVPTKQGQAHPTVQGLPWQQRPPLIGGFNAVKAKKDSEVLLQVYRFASTWDNAAQTPNLIPVSVDPLLVVGEHSKGRVAALATDLAPHWIGPMVDWGLPRVQAQAPNAQTVEVGHDYASFVTQLVQWVVGK